MCPKCHNDLQMVLTRQHRDSGPYLAANDGTSRPSSSGRAARIQEAILLSHANGQIHRGHPWSAFTPFSTGRMRMFGLFYAARHWALDPIRKATPNSTGMSPRQLNRTPNAILERQVVAARVCRIASCTTKGESRRVAQETEGTRLTHPVFRAGTRRSEAHSTRFQIHSSAVKSWNTRQSSTQRGSSVTPLRSEQGEETSRGQVTSHEPCEGHHQFNEVCRQISIHRVSKCETVSDRASAVACVPDAPRPAKRSRARPIDSSRLDALERHASAGVHSPAAPVQTARSQPVSPPRHANSGASSRKRLTHDTSRFPLLLPSPPFPLFPPPPPPPRGYLSSPFPFSPDSLPPHHLWNGHHNQRRYLDGFCK